MLGLRSLIPFLAIAILLVAPAEATTSYYQGASAEAAFNGALGSLTLLNPILTFSASNLVAGALLNANGTGINFQGIDDYHFNNATALAVNAGKLTGTQSAEEVWIAFPAAGIYAFGIHITTTSGSGNWCIELSHGACNYTVFNSSPSDLQFFGFVSNTPIVAPLYVRTTTGSATVVIADFEAYSVPEEHTMLLVGLGLVILRLARAKTRPGM